MEKLYTITEVADKLDLATKTLRRWEETGKFIGSRTLGGQRRYSISDIQILDAIKHGVIDSSADLLTPQQAAALCGVSIATIARWEDEGKIHPLITAGTTYYPRPRLLAKMNELKHEIPNVPLSAFEPVDLLPQPQLAPPAPSYSPRLTPAPPAPIPLPVPSPQPIPHLPSSHSQSQPLTISFTLPHIPKSTIYSIPLNLLVTLIVLMLYHNFVKTQAIPVLNQGSVQGVTDNPPQLALITSVLDPSGNLKAPSLTTPRLTLSPVSPTSTPTAGSIYFDASSQMVKLFANGTWQPLNSSGSNTPSVISGSSSLSKGSSNTNVVNDKISASSHITVTFNGDYSPARSYWITKNQGSFTLNLNSPVANDVSFDYTISNPTKSGNQTSTTQLKDNLVR